MKNNYNWWEDPKNKEEIDKISWWNHEERSKLVNLPIGLIEDGEYWIASTNDKTEEFLGKQLTGCGQGKTKEEAIKRLFDIIRWTHEYSEECRLNYQRWVPFRKGPWGKIGGNWFAIFGIHIYFRYGKRNKGGWFIPFTKLNISISSDWKIYRNYKTEKSLKK